MNSMYLEELAALDAMGALDGEDVGEFRRLSTNVNTEEQEEIADYETVAALIASTAEVKRPAVIVKERLLKQILEAVAAGQAHEGPRHSSNEAF